MLVPVRLIREGRKEPRTGKRVTVAATVRSPIGDVVVYSIHLEVFTGIIGRVWQMNGALKRQRTENCAVLSCVAVLLN